MQWKQKLQLCISNPIMFISNSYPKFPFEHVSISRVSQFAYSNSEDHGSENGRQELIQNHLADSTCCPYQQDARQKQISSWQIQMMHHNVKIEQLQEV